MKPLNPQQDKIDNSSLPVDPSSPLKSIIRTSAGLGITFGAYWKFKSNYKEMRRKFLNLNLTDSAKRLIERHFAFTSMDQKVTDFEKRLGFKDLIEVLPTQSEKETEISALLRKERQIREAMGPAQGEVIGTVKAATSLLGDNEQVARFEREFTSFRDDHFDRAMITTESMVGEEIPGKGLQQLTEKVKDMSMSQVEEMNRQLTVILDRVRLIRTRVSSFRQNVEAITRSVQRKIDLSEGSDKYKAWTDATNKAKTALDSQFKQFADTMKDITDLRPITAPIATNKDMYTRFWSVQGMRPESSFKKMIGPEAHKSLGKMIKESYEDKFLNTGPQDAIAKTEDAMHGIKGIIEKLQNESVTIAGKPSKVYERINIALSPGERTVTINAISNTPGRENIVMSFDVAQRKLGASVISHGGKNFSIPYTKQRDLLSKQIEEQIRQMPWRSQTPSTTAENIRNTIKNEMMTVSETGIFDMLKSAGTDKRILPSQERFYSKGFDNFNKILKNKMSRGGTLHVSVENTGKGGKPSRIGWVLKDSSGKTLDGKYFMFGAGGGTPAHLIGAAIDGVPVVKMIEEHEIGQVVDALSNVMQHPRLRGHGVKIVMDGNASGINTILDMAEKKTSGATDKIAALRLATREESILSSSSIASVSGYAFNARPLDMFRILQAHGAKDPELKKLIETKLLMIGIPGLNDMGREVFKKGTTNAFQQAYMDALFPEVVYLASISKKKGKYGTFLKEMDAVKHGRLPDRLVGGGYNAKDFQSLRLDYMRNVSPASWLSGSLGALEYSVGGPFSHLRRGRQDRSKSATQLRKLTQKDVYEMTERLRIQGQYADPAAVLMEQVYNPQFKSLHIMDPAAGFFTDEFIASDTLRNVSIPSEKVHIVNRQYLSRSIADSSGNVKIGTRLMRGSVLGRLGPENVIYEGMGKRSEGTITEASDMPNGDVRIVIHEESKIGGGMTVLSEANAGIISPYKTMDDTFRGIRPVFGAATLSAALEKNNPGVNLTMMWMNMFDYAGQDKTRQNILKGIVGRRLKEKDPGFFPLYINKRTGELDFKGGTVEYWRRFQSSFDISDVMKVAEELNEKTSGAFTITKVSHDAIAPKHGSMLDINDTSMEALRRAWTQPGAIRTNVEIAMSNLRRETNIDPTKNIALPDAEKIVAETTRLLTSGGSILEALTMGRPDIVRKLQGQGREVNMSNFLSEMPAYIGGLVTTKDGKSVLASVAGLIIVRNQAVFSQVGEIKPGNYRIAWMQAMRTMEGGQKLADTMIADAYKQSANTLARMMPYPIATGASSPKGMAVKPAQEVATFLHDFINMPRTKALAIEGWMPAQTMYELPNGNIVTKRQAIEQLDIPRYKFQDAIASGKAKVCKDPGKLNSRRIHPDDLREIVDTQPFVMAFKSHYAAEVKGSTTNAKIDRMLVSLSAREDTYPLEHIHPKTGEKKTFAIGSHYLFKMQEVLRLTTAGVPLDTSGRNGLGAVHDLLESTDSIKRELLARVATMDVPTIRLKGFTVSPIDALSVTTHAKAQEIVRMANDGGIVSDWAGQVAGVRNGAVDQLIGNMSWDESKYIANQMLGNIKKASPQAIRLRYLGGEKTLWAQLGQQPEVLDPKMGNALGILQQILKTHKEDKKLVGALSEHVLGGRVPGFVAGEKNPFIASHKFISGLVMRASGRANERSSWAAGSAGIGFMPSVAEFVGSNNDSDGDLNRFLMDSRHREKAIDLQGKNAFISQMRPGATLVERKGGMVTTIDKSGVFSSHPFTLDIDKIGGFEPGMESDIATKQYAGYVDTIGKNVSAHMNRMLTGRGGALANDLGQKDINDINKNLWEAMGAFIEGGALKGKAEGSPVDLTGEFVKRIGHYPSFVKFAKDLEERAKGKGQTELQKLFIKIPGTEISAPSSNGYTAMEVMLDAMRHGKSFKEGLFSNLTADATVTSTSMAASKLLGGQKGALVEAMGRVFETQGIPTRYNGMVQEGVISALKRNLKNEVGAKNWKRVSIGMGWAAAAGIAYRAATLFNGDGMGFLGDRAGTGAEPFNWKFTRPEYEMAGLLDQPYNNPYAKNPAYVVMDNPNNQEKMSRLNAVEDRDFFLVHQAVSGERVRDTITGQRPVDKESALSNLNRYGHV
jgi:hypothetical protein